MKKRAGKRQKDAKVFFGLRPFKDPSTFKFSGYDYMDVAAALGLDGAIEVSAFASACLDADSGWLTDLVRRTCKETFMDRKPAVESDEAKLILACRRHTRALADSTLEIHADYGRVWKALAAVKSDYVFLQLFCDLVGRMWT